MEMRTCTVTCITHCSDGSACFYGLTVIYLEASALEMCIKAVNSLAVYLVADNNAVAVSLSLLGLEC